MSLLNLSNYWGWPYSHPEQSTAQSLPPPKAYRASSVILNSIPHVSSVPPFPPSQPPPFFLPVSSLEDGTVFESSPPPWSLRFLGSKNPHSYLKEMELLRACQRITNFSTLCCPKLEGQQSTIDPNTTSRSKSNGQLTGQRAVTTVLDSQFCHRLESVLNLILYQFLVTYAWNLHSLWETFHYCSYHACLRARRKYKHSFYNNEPQSGTNVKV